MKLRLNKIGLAGLLMLGSVSAAFAADKEVLTPSEVLMQEVSIIGSKFNIKILQVLLLTLTSRIFARAQRCRYKSFIKTCSRR